MTAVASRFTPRNPSLLIGLSAIVLTITIGIKLFMELYVFPALDNFIVIDVPSKSGGQTYYVDPSEFAIVGNIAILVAAFMTALLVYLAKSGKSGALVLAMIVNFTFALLYFGVMFGNIAHAFWGEWWSVAGVAVALLIIAALELVFYQSIKPIRGGASPKSQ